MSAENPGEIILLPQLAGSLFNVEILSLPDWELRMGVLGTDPTKPSLQLPNLRSLSINGSSYELATAMAAFPNLVFLSLEIGPLSGQHSTEIRGTLPSLRTLKLYVWDFDGLEDFVEWSMPTLSHLDVHVGGAIEAIVPLVFLFVEIHGKKISSLRLRVPDDWVTLPENFWEQVPQLQYLGTS
ncbi:hypothetical protein M408DRAFT_193880, partial [Serendipita vermifera MAFF 305830]